MARYDWPAGPYSYDDQAGRASHLVQLRPPADLRRSDVPLPTAMTAPAPVRPRLVPYNEPSGAQNLWFPIGPSVMRKGQATGRPMVAGRIRDLQVEPAQGKRIYAASGSGGLWFSADRGATWRPLDEWMKTEDRSTLGFVANALSCGSVYVAWNGADDGSGDEIWLGTGEPPGGAGPQPGGQVAGIGFLHRPAGPASTWTVVKGGPASADFTTLRGRSVFRIAADPLNKDQLVAGTTNGLLVHPPGGAWTRPAGWVLAKTPGDVAVTRAGGKVRIWVAARSELYVAETAGTTIDPATITFSSVSLPDVWLDPAAVKPMPTDTALTLTATPGGTVLYVLGRKAKEDPTTHKKTVVAGLWKIDGTAAVAGLTATALSGLPEDLFGTVPDQSNYDMCIAVHPANPSLVYVGGSTVKTTGGYNAAIYRCEVSGSKVTPTLIGDQVHADVHQLRVGPPVPGHAGKSAVWVGCDGGVFRSDDDGDPGTFVACNDGLAVLEPGYVASHPTNPGIVAAGFQDNGTAVRIGDTVWEQAFEGDGGGVVYDPQAPNRYWRQYTGGDWQDSDKAAKRPVLRRFPRPRDTFKTSEKIESEAARFYSSADAVVHPLGGDTHLAFGTDRVWYSRDWGKSWVTLPSGTDPRASDNPDLKQDVLDPVDAETTTYNDHYGSTNCCDPTGPAVVGKGITAVKFARPKTDAAVGLHKLRLLVLFETGLAWLYGTRPVVNPVAFNWVEQVREIFREPVPGSETTDFQAGNPLGFLPVKGLASDIAVHDPDAGIRGSCYLTTTGPRYEDDAATAARRETLWFFDGTNQWIPCGLRTVHPRGTWPAADKRVTAAALGVVVDPDDKDIVYVGTSVGVVKGKLTIGGTPGAPTYVWAFDQFVNGLPEAAVQDLSVFKAGSTKLLRVALQARGVWETDLANATSSALTYLRLYPSDTRRILPTLVTGPPTAGEPKDSIHWYDSPDIVVAPGPIPASAPTEAGLLDLPRYPSTSNGRVPVNDRHPVVHVLAHHRWSQPESVPSMWVALLRHDLPADGNVPINKLWPILVTAATSHTIPAFPLPDGWTAADSSFFWRNPSDPIDYRTPRVISFTLDLSGLAVGSAVVLLAVVMAGSNQISLAELAAGPPIGTATKADQLVAASPHAAAKAIEIIA